MAELKRLIWERGQVKARLTRIRNFFNGIDENSLNSDLIAELNERFSDSETILADYHKCQASIAFADDSTSHEEDAEAFLAAYYGIIPKIRGFLTKHNHAGVQAAEPVLQQIETKTSDPFSVRLPPIILPTFSGALEDWDEFHDAFDAMINENQQLSVIEKFRYLVSAVKGDAAQALKSLKITAENYSVAWAVLKRRFENKKLIVQNNLMALFELEYIKKDSRAAIQRTLDSILKIMQCLKKYEQPTVDLLIIHIISVKLTVNTRTEWGLFKPKGDFPTFEEFIEFLENRCERLGAMEIETTLFPNNKVKINEARAHVSTAKQPHGCVYCKENHQIYNCEGFLKLNVNSRIASARRLHLCMNCLKRNHGARFCSVQPCQKCGKKHNTLLHLEFDRVLGTNQIVKDTVEERAIEAQASDQIASAATKESSIRPYETQASVNHSAFYASTSQIVLSTACVQVADIYGNVHTCRCLLDPGSQSSFVTSELCNRLGLEKKKYKLVITGVGQLNSNVNHKTTILIKSRINDYSAEVTCLVLDHITDHLPTISFDINKLNIPQTIRLADPKCSVSQKIDMLIGADLFWELLCNGQHNLGKNLPVLQKTRLGWILGGKFIQNDYINPINKTIVNFNAIGIQEQLEKFWMLEECNSGDPYLKYSQEEKYCEDHFLKTHKRTEAFPHRFIVNIPLKDNVSNLGKSREFALKRFYSLERKLERDSKLKAEYTAFLSEYENLGHMTKINDESLELINPKYYLPHHSVIKETSSTTKVRVVFDASMKTSFSGPSLNDVQCVGPTIQDDIFAILIRFRKHEFVISADIAKMYRQILINKEQRNLQLILWRSDSSQEVNCYRLNTVTYGMAASSFLSIRSLKQLAVEFRNIYPASSRVIESDFYVDDLLTGFESREAAIKAQTEISEILKTGGFELRKWASNDKVILNHINAGNNLEQELIQISENVGSLGVSWNPSADKLHYFSKEFSRQKHITKRTILSCIGQIFDPLGLLGPIIITAKIIIQQLWQCKLSWDESIPLDLHTRFVHLRDQLHIIDRLDIPRHVIAKNPIKIELHGFADASERAYGACLYIRSLDQLGSYHVSLLCAKSRVAPLKNVSLPRLELCGALLLANLAHKVKKSIKIDFDAVVYWCDSTISLGWIRSAPNKWKTFVANRVSEIQQLTDVKDWRHVSTENNPADLISRGIEPSLLKNATLWWKGPAFLAGGKAFEHRSEIQIESFDNLPEARAVVNLAFQPECSIMFQKYSSLWKLQRIIAYCFRFVNNARSNRNTPLSGPLSTNELERALVKLLKLVQMEAFPHEVSHLSAKRDINRKSSVLSLNPFIDDQGLLRVGGRIQKSSFNYSKKHPVILPAGHILTKLIIKHEHIRLMHGGINLMLASLREKYWIISGKNAIKQIVHECVTCFRAKPKPIEYVMGSLPKNRVTPAPPFYNCGVDYAGPILIKNKVGRGCKLIKSYICIFVCFATKAIHIELASDLSTNEFVAAMRRFVARRGMPLNIYSDNGGNFVGANSELQEFRKFLLDSRNQAEIIEAISKDNVAWHFIPSRSPHFGGLWEAGVKSIKGHLKRTVGNAHLTFGELNTLLVQIEAILNSRPLSPISSDPNDTEPLTPSHFLIGRPLMLVPEPDLAEISDNRLSKYQHVQKLMQHFWKRWSLEYIGELQGRAKWKRGHPAAVKIGSLVILRNDNMPPLKWDMGRIVDLHPGSDGVIRVVSLKTSSGNVIKRAVTKLCVLPIV